VLGDVHRLAHGANLSSAFRAISRSPPQARSPSAYAGGGHRVSRSARALALLEGEPARLVALAAHGLVDLPDPPPPRPEQVKAHDLQHSQAAAAGVDVADVAELLDERPADAGLLPDLAEGGLVGPLA